MIASTVLTMLSMPGCEQPTTSTMPSGVSMASESSRSSSVPGLSDTSAIRCMPGAICVVLSISRMSACGHAAPKRITSAGLPSK